ncbi:hypothetical protein [Streptomyces sp. NPDC019539]|uniref:hypothetical protein n=1 Tax=Streptomyces sp. NPDC019539 TaxID=3365063 RepID=UPI00379CCA8F
MGVVLLVAGALLALCPTLGALPLLVRAVQRRRGVVAPAVEPVWLPDFRWEGERHEP